MNSTPRSSQISVGIPRGTYTWRYNLIFISTLILSALVTISSFANNDLKNNAYLANTTLHSTSEAPENSSVFAQTFIMPNDSVAVTETISDCTADNKFMDDGLLYKDDLGKPRRDTLTICPNNISLQIVKVQFLKFDLALNDTLIAFDGDLQAVKLGQATIIGKATGVGASNAFGSWVKSSCAPGDNPTGCLSFLFKTNGDYKKGIGWEAWASCEESGIVITPPSINNVTLKCDEISRIQTIKAATITTSCGNITNDSTIVRIKNTLGMVCVDTCLSKNQNMSVTREFGIGTYLVEYKLKGDTSKSELTYFSITPPSLTCNDEVNIPLGYSCGVMIEPDMLLENPCDTIQGTMYYQITIKSSTGQVLVEGTGIAGDYPVLTKDKLNQCGNNSLVVEIKRTYFAGLTLPYCNSGVQEESCSTIVNITDNTAPFFLQQASADTIYACEPDLSEVGLFTTKPTAIDNCSEVSVTFQGATKISSGSKCDEVTTYLVKWVAKDACQNPAVLNDTVRVIRPGRDKIVQIPDVILSCGEDANSVRDNYSKAGIPGIMVGVQSNGVFTPTDTIDLNTDSYVCNYILKKDDISLSSSCGQKYLRSWTLIDWCDTDTGPVVIDNQIIEIKDTLAPVIHCLGYNSIANAEKIQLSAFQCADELYFVPPTATDNCDNFPNVKAYTVEQYENDGWWKLGDNLDQAGALGAGTYRIGYRAFDYCPEQTKEDSCFRYIVLEDVTKPSAVCQDVLNISLSNDYARIAAKDIDAGSWDACGIEKLLVRREVCGTPGVWQGPINTYVKSRLNNKLDPTGWSEYADFSCCDLHQNVKIELLVIDNSGNYNFCWMEVRPEDKISPVCTNLPNEWDYCDNFHNGELGTITDTDGDKQYDNDEWLKLEGDLADFYNEKYGIPFYACTDNLTCKGLSLEQEYQLIDLECGVYKVKRRYRVTDWDNNSSNWAEQFISIEYRPNWSFTLPVDWTGTCGDGVPAENLNIQNGSCDLMSYEVYDQQFDVVNDACFKVIRTYHIINWCKYQAGDQPIRLNRIADNRGDVVSSQTITSAQYASASYFTYVQILKVADSEAPIITIDKVESCMNINADCSDTKTFSASATDCNEASTNNLEFQWEIFENNSLIGTGSGNTFNWLVSTVSDYKVKWRVADKCGNSAWAEDVYNFYDCKKPTPYCLSGLALELGSNSEVAIWANDFNLNSFDNCTANDKLDLKIWHQSLGTDAPTDLESVQQLPTSITFSCTYVGMQTVHIYVIDEAGNYDFCITSLNVQDNSGICPKTGGTLAGRIYTEYGATVQNTEVTVMNNGSMMTAADGNFNFNVDGNSTYTIVPKKDINVLNGVSTFDLVKITKHILGKEKFTSPYQYIAADVNASGDVSTFDIIQLRKLILDLTDEFSNNTSWRFVDASYDFQTDEPLNEPFPEQIQINAASGSQPNLDFIAVKIGDINGNASANNLVIAEERNTPEDLTIQIEDRLVKVGETVDVRFEANDFATVEGYQFTLQFEGLELLNFDEGISKTANFNFNLQDRGYLTTSWNDVTNKAKQPTLFNLTFKATTDASLSSLIKINSKFATAEAYRNDGSLLGVTLQPKKSAALLSDFSVQQNTPNPFRSTTLVDFNLPESAVVELTIMDVQGRVIKKQSADFESGAQQLEITSEGLRTGTYYYQLVTPFGVATKKMIVIE